MRRAAWVRGTVALVAWTVVTAVATMGSWLGLSSVFTSGDASHPATVVSSADQDAPALPTTEPSSPPVREPQSAEQQPQDTAEPTDEEQQQTTPSEEPQGEAWRDWTAIGNGVYERTFVTEGGTATVQLYQEQVALLSASPADGYTAAADTSYPDRMLIAFFSDIDTVTIDVGWWQDEPYAEVDTM